MKKYFAIALVGLLMSTANGFAEETQPAAPLETQSAASVETTVDPAAVKVEVEAAQDVEKQETKPAAAVDASTGVSAVTEIPQQPTQSVPVEAQ